MFVSHVQRKCFYSSRLSGQALFLLIHCTWKERKEGDGGVAPVVSPSQGLFPALPGYDGFLWRLGGNERGSILTGGWGWRSVTGPVAWGLPAVTSHSVPGFSPTRPPSLPPRSTLWAPCHSVRDWAWLIGNNGPWVRLLPVHRGFLPTPTPHPTQPHNTINLATRG